MYHILRTSFGLVFIALIAGCDSTRVFEQNHDFNDGFWDKNNTVSFGFEVPDTTVDYNIYFNLRNTQNYPNSNIYISYQLLDSTTTLLDEKLQSFDLFDPKSGRPYGRSGLGDIFDHQFVVLENYKFKTTGLKTINLRQYMRYDSLKEVISTGVRVERATK